MPRWAEVLRYWQSFDVPDVDLLPRPWLRDLHPRWDKRALADNGTHFFVTTSPEDQSAELLTWGCYCIRRGPMLNETLRATFMLEAFARVARLDAFRYEVLYPAKRVHSVSSSWWSPNARYVIPDLAPSEYPGPTLTSWKQIVEAAANNWRRVIDQWVILCDAQVRSL